MQIFPFIIVIALANYNPPEQIAFDYFVKEILSKNYPKTTQVYFSGHSEAKRITTSLFSQCFDLKRFNKIPYSQNDSLSSVIDLPFDKAIIRKATGVKPRGLNLLIYKSTRYNNFFYTYIQVYKPSHFIDHYLIKASSDTGEVTGTCRISETI